jgi:hypothetical protein
MVYVAFDLVRKSIHVLLTLLYPNVAKREVSIERVTRDLSKPDYTASNYRMLTE